MVIIIIYYRVFRLRNHRWSLRVGVPTMSVKASVSSRYFDDDYDNNHTRVLTAVVVKRHWVKSITDVFLFNIIYYIWIEMHVCIRLPSYHGGDRWRFTHLFRNFTWWDIDRCSTVPLTCSFSKRSHVHHFDGCAVLSLLLWRSHMTCSQFSPGQY